MNFKVSGHTIHIIDGKSYGSKRLMKTTVDLSHKTFTTRNGTDIYDLQDAIDSGIFIFNKRIKEININLIKYNVPKLKYDNNRSYYTLDDVQVTQYRLNKTLKLYHYKDRFYCNKKVIYPIKIEDVENVRSIKSKNGALVYDVLDMYKFISDKNIKLITKTLELYNLKLVAEDISSIPEVLAVKTVETHTNIILMDILSINLTDEMNMELRNIHKSNAHIDVKNALEHKVMAAYALLSKGRNDLKELMKEIVAL